MTNIDYIKGLSIVWIGAGNLATRLSLAMYEKGFAIKQVYSRTESSAAQLAAKLNASWCTDIKQIMPGADLYIFSIKDSALNDVLAEMPFRNGLWLHTAGSVPMSVFSNYADHYGVFYPLQTFSKQREIKWNDIPFFIEGVNEEMLRRIDLLARAFSDQIYPVTSEYRRFIHLSAVFVCNFVNHMYVIGGKLAKEVNVPFSVLLPLIRETSEKVAVMSPESAQTGPAVRYDENVMNKHLELLSEYPDWEELYRKISLDIYNLHQNKENE